MDGFNKAIELMPSHIRQALKEAFITSAEEIRLRLGEKLTVVDRATDIEIGSLVVSARDLQAVLEKATGASMHSAAQALAEGYINWGGLRIGVCGHASMQNGAVSGFRTFTSLAVRIPKECRGICDRVISSCYKEGFESTLIVSPPGYGKTTALREMVRKLSDCGYRISVADERNELSASGCFGLGRNSDVLIGVPKAKAAMMLLRGMNPQILAMDEITHEKDIAAISNVAACGVEVLASAHGYDRRSLEIRPLYKELLALGIFKYCVVISRHKGMRIYTAERIYE